MEPTKRYTFRLLSLETIGILVALLFLVPFYFVLTNSFKPFAELLADTTSLPKAASLHNYKEAWKIMSFPTVFVHSLFITVASNVGLVIISSMAAYRMVRINSRLNRILFMLFISGLSLSI